MLQDRLDLRGVVGNGIQPSVLREAGADDADMLIACAPLDETNLVACKIAHDVFHIPTRIARVRSPEFTDGSPLMGKEGFAVDEVICPEESLTTYIRKLIQYPEALQVLEFSQGLVSLIAVRAVEGGPMVHHVISDLPQLVPGLPMRIVAIYRRDALGVDRRVICDGSTRIELGDEVFVLAANEHIRRVLDALHERGEPVRRVIIAGGGRVGLRLARKIARRLPGQDHRGQRAALRIPEPRSCPATRWCCAATRTDEELLEHEGVQETDLFLALTSDDEDNIMACLLAKRMGARRVLALINRRAYADLVQGRARRSTSRCRRRRPSSASCWRTCAAATSRRCTACAAARPKRWRRWCAATRRARRWWAGASTRSTLPRGRADRRHRARRPRRGPEAGQGGDHRRTTTR